MLYSSICGEEEYKYATKEIKRYCRAMEGG